MISVLSTLIGRMTRIWLRREGSVREELHAPAGAEDLSCIRSSPRRAISASTYSGVQALVGSSC